MNAFICSMCGHVEFNIIPASCPVCKSPKEKYSQNDRIFEESAEKSKEAAVKHIPVVTINKKCGLISEQSCTDVSVRVGSTLHPMEVGHHIRFIDCYVDGTYISRMQLSPGVFPAGNFHLKTPGSKVQVVENCNIHGYWKSEVGL